jgi:hypothetical protein
MVLGFWMRLFSSIDGPSVVKIIVWIVLGIMAVVSYVLDMRRDRQLQSKTDKIEGNTQKTVEELSENHGASVKDQVAKVLKLAETAAREASEAKNNAAEVKDAVKHVDNREMELEKLVIGLKSEFHRFIVHEVNNSLNHSQLAKEAERILKEADEKNKTEDGS